MGNVDLLDDACASLSYTRRAMFGGHGFFAQNGGMFAGVVDDDRIMLKFADEAARDELVALGGAPWTYAEKMTMREWIVVPDSFYDEPTTLAAWARRAYKLVPPKKAKPAKKAGKGKASLSRARKASSTKKEKDQKRRRG